MEIKKYFINFLGYSLNKITSLILAAFRLIGQRFQSLKYKQEEKAIEPSKPVETKPKKKLIFIDTETTGLFHSKGDRLVEIACCHYENGSLVAKYHTLLNPERFIPTKVSQIHGITNDLVKDAPKFRDIAQDFLNFIQDSVLIGHNSKRFDIPFINNELKKANLSVLENDQEDTLEIHRKLYPGQPAKLDNLCERFNIDLKERIEKGHGALLDAQLTAECYFQMMTTINTIKENV